MFYGCYLRPKSTKYLITTQEDLWADMITYLGLDSKTFHQKSKEKVVALGDFIFFKIYFGQVSTNLREKSSATL